MKKLKVGDEVIINVGRLFKGTRVTITATVNIDGKKKYLVEANNGNLTGCLSNSELLKP